MVTIENILVAVDFDDSVDQLLNYGESLAVKFGAKLWVVYVAPPDPDFVGYEPGPQYIRDFKAEELRGEHRRLQELCDTFIDKEVPYEALLIQGSTVETLLEEVIKLNSDLLIVGTHKRSFLYELISESVSLELFRNAKIPLLTVPIEED